MYQRVRRVIDRLEEVMMIVLLATMTLLTFIQVVLRYGFGSGFVWSLEATTYCFAWLVLIGMSHGVRERTHIAVDFVNRRVSERSRIAIGYGALALCMLYALLMLYGSVIYVQGIHGLGHHLRDIPVPRWILLTIMPIAFGLLTLRFTEIGWALVTGRVSGLGFGRTTA